MRTLFQPTDRNTKAEIITALTELRAKHNVAAPEGEAELDTISKKNLLAIYFETAADIDRQARLHDNIADHQESFVPGETAEQTAYAEAAIAEAATFSEALQMSLAMGEVTMEEARQIHRIEQQTRFAIHSSTAEASIQDEIDAGNIDADETPRAQAEIRAAGQAEAKKEKDAQIDRLLDELAEAKASKNQSRAKVIRAHLRRLGWSISKLED